VTTKEEGLANSRRPKREKPRKPKRPKRCNKNEKCLETDLDGYRVIACQSEKIISDVRSGKLTPARVPPIDFVPSSASAKVASSSRFLRAKRKKETRRENDTPKNVSSLNEKTDSDSAKTRNSEVNRVNQLSDYHPDTESGESRLSDTTEYFRPHSASIRDQLPLPVPKSVKKRKVAKKTTRPIKMFNTIKKEPRDSLVGSFATSGSRAALQQHQNMLMGQHPHHSAHMALPLVVNPLGAVNWPPFAIHPLHLNDPLIMASLHTVQQVQLQKPLQAAQSRGKWNSMHARIARYIQEQQTKSKVKKRKSSLSNRSGSSAFASLPVPDSVPSLLDRQFLPNPSYAHFAAHKRFKR